MVIDKNIPCELNLYYEELIENYYGKWLVICHSNSYDYVCTDEVYDLELQLVESLDHVIAICDTEEEASNYLKTINSKFLDKNFNVIKTSSEFLRQNYYAFCLNPEVD